MGAPQSVVLVHMALSVAFKNPGLSCRSSTRSPLGKYLEHQKTWAGTAGGVGGEPSEPELNSAPGSGESAEGDAGHPGHRWHTVHMQNEVQKWSEVATISYYAMFICNLELQWRFFYIRKLHVNTLVHNPAC